MKILNSKKLYFTKFETFLLSLSIITSILLSYGFYFLIWIAFIPLIYLSFENNHKKTLILSIFYGVITSILFFNWVYDVKLNYDIQLYILIIIIFTFYFSLFLTLVSFFSQKIKSYYVILLPPTVWLILLFAYSLLPIEIYWMDFAIFHPSLAPLVWYIGSYGITFIIILFNSIMAYYFIKKNKYVVFFGFFLIVVILILTVYSNYSDFPKNEGKLKVALLQGNFPYEWEWRQSNAFGLIFDTYINMTLQASKEKPDIIIWPEYSLPNDITINRTVFTKLQKTAQRLNTTIIVGSLSYVDTKYKYKDTALVFKPEGSLDRYDSLKPFFLEKDVVRGNTSNIIKHNDNKFGVIICNEESMQSIARNYANKGSQFIVSMSNNQDYGRGQSIISQFTKLRAAENAKYVVRATNDGITQIVNPFGKVVYSLEPRKQKILIGDIYVNSYKTFYTKYGNILVYALIILSIILMIKKRQYGKK